MKTYFFYCLFLLAVPFTAYEQSTLDTVPPYRKSPFIPSFNILQTDSTTWFSKDSLPKNRPVVIIYFSPECSHCQYEAKLIAQNIDSLRNAFFVWVSFHPISDIKMFYTKYGLDKFDNMRMGRDPKYFIPAYFKVEFTPYMAVYNSKGRFLHEFREGAKPEELIEAIR